MKKKLADVKPVKCWAHISDRLYPTSSNVALNSEDAPCILMTAAHYAKLKRELAELRRSTALFEALHTNSGFVELATAINNSRRKKASG